MLIGNLFDLKEIIEKDSSNCTTKVSLNKNHPIFKGHFPGSPVLPGVCQIEIIKEILNKILKTKFQLTKSSNMKFMAVVNPLEHDEMEIKLNYQEIDDSVKVKSTSLFLDGKVNFKFSGEFRKES